MTIEQFFKSIDNYFLVQFFMLHLLKEKSRFYHFLKSRYRQNKKCRKTFATPGIEMFISDLYQSLEMRIV